MNEKYLTYDLETLASDHNFVAWVKGWAPPNQAKAWKKWIAANPDKKEMVEEAKAIVEAMQFDKTLNLPISKAKLWGRITESLQEELPKPKRPKTRTRILQITTLLAAAVLTLFLINRKGSPELDQILTAPGQQLVYTLPDQSSVTLNAGSELLFEDETFNARRQVTLKGEAFFEVEKGAGFQVKTPNGTVEVLGTSFNVYARDNKFEVICVSGRVEVSNKRGNKKAILTPGARTNLEKGLEVTIDNENKRVPWLEGEYRFENTPLKEVFESLERQFAIEITADNKIGQATYSGLFMLDTLEKALYDVTWPMGLEYKIDGDQVSVSKK